MPNAANVDWTADLLEQAWRERDELRRAHERLNDMCNYRLDLQKQAERERDEALRALEKIAAMPTDSAFDLVEIARRAIRATSTGEG